MTYIQVIACTAGLEALIVFVYWVANRKPKEPTAYTSELNDIGYYKQEGIMIKEYKKVKNIKAEQFDGSEKMMKKYRIFKDANGAPSHKYIMMTLEGSMAVSAGNWIATGILNEHWAIEDSIFKETYTEVAK